MAVWYFSCLYRRYQSGQYDNCIFISVFFDRFMWLAMGVNFKWIIKSVPTETPGWPFHLIYLSLTSMYTLLSHYYYYYYYYYHKLHYYHYHHELLSLSLLSLSSYIIFSFFIIIIIIHYYLFHYYHYHHTLFSLSLLLLSSSHYIIFPSIIFR